MSDQRKLNERRIEWLMDNHDLWYSECYQRDQKELIEEIKNRMRRNGLYNRSTLNEKMNIVPLMKKARKKLDMERGF